MTTPQFPDEASFNRGYNVGWVDSSLPDLTNKQWLRHYVASLALYGAVLLFLWHNAWYGELTRAGIGDLTVKELLGIVLLTYLFLAPPLYFWLKPKSLWQSKPLHIFSYLKRLMRLPVGERNNWITSASGDWRPTHKEGQAIALFFVKCFFGPLMLSFTFNAIPMTIELFEKLGALTEAINSGGTLSGALVSKLAWHGINLPSTQTGALSISDQAIAALGRVFNDNLYLFLLKALFLIDTLLFSFGYFWEAGFLKNRVRSVDVSVLGLFTCLCVYPPFNMVTAAVIEGVPNDMAAVAGHGTATWVIRALAVSMVIIYVSASVALFTKASNLTNRGTVSWGPYRFVRHPAYITKTLFWYLTALPFFFPGTMHPHFDNPNPWLNGSWMAASLLAYTLIYFLRSITEERHLAKDPEYRAYMERVRYRFIPGIW